MGEILDQRDCVLVVDDDEQIRCLLGEILTDEGYRVVLAASADQGLQLACSIATKLVAVIIDIVLPGSVSGPRFVEELREIAPAVQVIFISGYSQAVVEGSGVLPRESYFLAKPFSVDQLLRILRKA
jgi:DNA-binding NtrC family response regulator